MAKKLTTEILIQQFITMHGDTYDYSLVEWSSNTTPVKIICKLHGLFEQEPHVHKRGSGCRECGGNKPLTTKTCIENFKQVHGDTYTYNNLIYKNKRTKLTITCKEHGDFQQYSCHHMAGSGCPTCGERLCRHGRNTYINRATTLYYIKLKKDDKVAYKIGLTMETIKRRYNREIKQGLIVETIKTWNYENGAEAYDKEQEIIKNNADKKSIEKLLIYGGNTEVFDSDVLKLS